MLADRVAMLRQGQPLLWGVIAIALTTITGWILSLPLLTNWAPWLARQMPMTAIALLAIVLALMSRVTGLRRWLGWAVAVVAALSVAQTATGIELGIDAWLASLFGRPEAHFQNWRMASVTGGLFIATAVAVACLDSDRWRWLVPVLAVGIGLLAGAELIMLTLGGTQHGAMPAFGPVSAPTGVAFLLLAAELLLRQPLDMAELARRPGLSLGIRGWLAAFGVVAALPVLLFAGIAAQRVASAERQATLVDLEHRTEAAANKIERYLQSLQELAVTLATTLAMQTDNLPAVYEFSKRAMEAGKVGRAVAVVDPQGQMLLNTRRPFGVVLPAAGDVQGVAEAWALKAPRIGDLFTGAISVTHVLTMWVPVVRDGQVTALLGVTAAPQDVTAALREERLPEGWIVAVLDRQGVIAGRSHDAEIFVGQSASSELLASIRNGQRGVFPSVTANGRPVASTFRTLSSSGWTVTVGVPAALIEAPASASRRFMLGLGLASVLAAVSMAFVVGLHMSRAIADIAHAAVEVGNGGQPSIASSSVHELDEVSHALTAARVLINEREAALRESEGRLSLALSAAHGGAWEWQIGAERGTWSAECYRLFGLDPAEGVPTFAQWRERCVHPDDRGLIDRDIEGARSGSSVIAHDYRVVLPNGEIRWISARGQIHADEGKPPRIVGLFLDITGRKRAELAVEEARRLTAVACEAGRMGTWHLDVSANRADYSAEALDLIGIKHDQWDGTLEALEAQVHPDDIDRRRRDRALGFAAGERLDHNFRVRLPDSGVRWLHARGRILRNAGGTATEAFGVILDITEQKRAEERQQALIRELDHRVKNTLARVQAIVLRSREGATTTNQFFEALMGRLDALAQAHSALSRGEWKGGSLGLLVHQELAPYANATNTSIEGPEILLNPEATLPMVLALHELATNAAKYGALSAPGGRVRVSWAFGANADGASHLVLDWQESGGPPVVAPSGRGRGQGGYGSRVIRELIPYELADSTVDFDLAPAGVRCRIEIPLEVVSQK